MMGDCDTCPRSETCKHFEPGEICFEVSDREENKDERKQMKDFITQICFDTLNDAIIFELESLNTEIEEVKDWVGCGNKRYFSDVEVHSIINKRISKLKGESNE